MITVISNFLLCQRLELTHSELAKRFCFWETIYSGPIRPTAITVCKCVVFPDAMVQLLL